MGLDMYLSRTLRLRGYGDADTLTPALKAAGYAGPVADGANFGHIRFYVAYWRKANAIHKWFVDNVQGGRDDCGEYYVTCDKLRELLALCEKVLDVAIVSEGQPVQSGTIYRPGKDPEPQFTEGRALLNGEEVHALLPTQGGFFFGSTDYDEWYIRDVESTVEQIRTILADPECPIGFEYSSSW